MQLPKSVAKRLRHMLEEMQEEYLMHEHKIQVLIQQRDELRREIEETEQLLKLAAPDNGAAAEERVHKEAGAEKESIVLANTGLRDAVRVVLGNSKRGLGPTEVARRMEQNGFVDGDNKTKLVVRVSNEMWRMAKNGKLAKTGHKYRLPPEQRP